MNSVVLPVIIPLLTAIAALIMGKPSLARRILVIAASTVQVAVAIRLGVLCWNDGPRAMPIGGWSAALGIILVVDLLSTVMLTLSSIIVLAGEIYGFYELPARFEHPLRIPLIQFLMLGINLAFCTGDLFNLFVAFEVTLMASYALLTLEADNWDIKQAFPYVTINILASTLLLAAAGMCYSLFGTLNFAHIARTAAMHAGDPRLQIIAMLFLVVFSMKAGLFPFYYWLPHSYPTLPTPVAALFSGVLTNVGIYVLLRLFCTVLPHDMQFAHSVLMWLSGMTMLLGVIGAISRNYIRGILSFHKLSQVGFMTLAIGFFTPASITAAIFYIIHYIIVKSSLFLIGGVGACLNRTDNLASMGGLWRNAPFIGILFLCQGLSLAGLPPLSGFWGKYLIVVAGIRKEEFILVGITIVASVLTLLSMLKIWQAAFWGEPEGSVVHREDRRWPRLAGVAAVLAIVSLSIGFGAEGFIRLSQKAADAALDRNRYIEVVTTVQGKDGEAH